MCFIFEVRRGTSKWEELCEIGSAITWSEVIFSSHNTISEEKTKRRVLLVIQVKVAGKFGSFVIQRVYDDYIVSFFISLV